MSETYYRQQILGQFADSDDPEQRFHIAYKKLGNRCLEVLGFDLLRPMAEGDDHYVSGIRLPSTEEQRDLDELVLCLTKVLIDSLNEQRLKVGLLAMGVNDPIGGISRLEAVLRSGSTADWEPRIKFLRNLQSVRSSGTAHRKGRDYEKAVARLNAKDRSVQAVSRQLLHLRDRPSQLSRA